MIRLYQFAPAFGLPNASPFCMKVETYLRMTGLPYECPRGASHFKAPKGKLPYIEDDGKVVADSSFIIEHLKRTRGDPLDAQLGALERAHAIAFQRLLEEDLYWAAAYSRWIDEAGWVVAREAFFGRLPLPLRFVLPPLARRGIRSQLHGQGMGRHSRDEIYAIGCRDLTALADFLGGKPFFLGERPASLDASAYAFLANLLWVPVESPLKAHAKTRPNLEAYCRRMRDRYYGK
ncbi:MAG: glutathione S-transferase family protein [Betaproteobacteria bacterium]|nr:glutathione S-transferase family protein [Betaproteobacteria bacterium]